MSHQILAVLFFLMSAANLYWSFQPEKKDQPAIKVSSPTWLPDRYSLNGEIIELETMANFLNSNKLLITYMGAKLHLDQTRDQQFYELMFETNKPIKQVSVVKP